MTSSPFACAGSEGLGLQSYLQCLIHTAGSVYRMSHCVTFQISSMVFFPSPPLQIILLLIFNISIFTYIQHFTRPNPHLIVFSRIFQRLKHWKYIRHFCMVTSCFSIVPGAHSYFLYLFGWNHRPQYFILGVSFGGKNVKVGQDIQILSFEIFSCSSVNQMIIFALNLILKGQKLVPTQIIKLSLQLALIQF